MSDNIEYIVVQQRGAINRQFRVYNKKKMKYWRMMAENISPKNNYTTIAIIKEVKKE